MIKSHVEQQFLLYASADKRVLILETDRNSERLLSSTTWMIDGTFSIVPKFYKQLVTIMGILYHEFYPLIYVLMVNKTQIDYEYVLETLQDIAVNNNLTWPKSINICPDFELACGNSFIKFFDDDNIYRCFFHLAQSLYRRIQLLGLAAIYNIDDNMHIKCK